MVCRIASSAKVRDSGRLEIRPKYLEEFAHCGMSMEHARLVRSWYLEDCLDLKTLPTVEKQEALTRPASLITNAATADVEGFDERAPLSAAVLNDEKTGR